MRKWLIALLFLLGCLCLVVYLRLGDDTAMEKKPSWSLVYSGRSPLGALGAYKDGFAACNGKGDLIVFSTGKEPMTYKISEYSFSAPPLEKDGIVYVGAVTKTAFFMHFRKNVASCGLIGQAIRLSVAP